MNHYFHHFMLISLEPRFKKHFGCFCLLGGRLQVLIPVDGSRVQRPKLTMLWVWGAACCLLSVSHGKTKQSRAYTKNLIFNKINIFFYFNRRNLQYQHFSTKGQRQRSDRFPVFDDAFFLLLLHLLHKNGKLNGSFVNKLQIAVIAV